MTRTFVVTGSASGIGAASARMLRAQGDRVIGIDLHDADIEADLATAAGRASAVARAGEAAGGTVDAVVACAGISAPLPATVAINFFGVTGLVTGLLPALRASSAPRVAVVSSMASLHPVSADLVDACLSGDETLALKVAQGLVDAGPETGYLCYSSSKRALSRWVRRESVGASFAGAGIPLNAVAPGIVLTPMTADLLTTPESTAGVDASVPMPLHYHQPPESIAALLCWLTSEANTHMAGQTIYCDGGSDAVLRGDDVWSWADPKVG